MTITNISRYAATIAFGALLAGAPLAALAATPPPPPPNPNSAPAPTAAPSGKIEGSSALPVVKTNASDGAVPNPVVGTVATTAEPAPAASDDSMKWYLYLAAGILGLAVVLALYRRRRGYGSRVF